MLVGFALTKKIVLMGVVLPAAICGALVLVLVLVYIVYLYIY